MDDWMYSLNRKKHQRRLNKFVRNINRGICEDDLWDGRFYIKQKRTSWYVYEDRSGGELYAELEYVDRNTGNTMTVFDSDNSFCRWNGYKLWERMNYFIVEWCNVWAESPAPYEAKKLREEAKNVTD